MSSCSKKSRSRDSKKPTRLAKPPTHGNNWFGPTGQRLFKSRIIVAIPPWQTGKFGNGSVLDFGNSHLEVRRGTSCREAIFEPKNRIDEVAGKCEFISVTNQAAYILRENTGTSGIVESARAAVSVLAEHGIPHLIVGGLAVQEHGYPRVTIDVDIVVPDVLEAVEFLTASLTGPFYRVHGVHDRVEDRRNGVMIDLLPAGKVLRRGCKVPFPQPGKIAEQIQIVTLEQLISLKLDSWAGSPARRLKDKADVNELILRRKLPRELGVAPAVRPLYLETWDALQAEK
jgi:hypothetical protein